MLREQENSIRKALKNWYNIHKRTLPWRETDDPYKIWISEIILQQTRVNQGFDYYLRFIDRFPDVKDLATADEREVLKFWQGLGYYSRARNLHKAALQIMDKFNGTFPEKYEDVLSLSGIGTYTASAICSFAYHQNYAVLDGNVFRVLSRLYAIATPINTGAGQKEFSQIAENLLDTNDPHTHNQAIMEFGALQCVPVSPDCENCALNDCCKAYQLGLVGQLPVKQGKIAVTNRYFHYFFVRYNGFTYLRKREGNDIWKNLYEFPLIETDQPLLPEDVLKSEPFGELFNGICNIQIEDVSNSIKHVLSHRNVHTRFFTVIIDAENSFFSRLIKIPVTEITRFPVSRLTEMFLEKL